MLQVFRVFCIESFLPYLLPCRPQSDPFLFWQGPQCRVLSCPCHPVLSVLLGPCVRAEQILLSLVCHWCLRQSLPWCTAPPSSAGTLRNSLLLAIRLLPFAGLFLIQINIYVNLTVWFQEEICKHGMGELFHGCTWQYKVGMSNSGTKLL